MIKYNEFKAIGFDIWVSFDYLISKNVPKGTIQNGISKFRKKGCGKWKHLSDQNNQKVFFDLNSIPKQTKQRYKLDSAEDIIEAYGVDIFKDEDDLRLFQKKQFLIQAFSIVAKNKWSHYTQYYSQYYPDFKLINLLGSTHAVIKEIILLSDERYPMKLIFEAYRDIPVTTKLYFRTTSYQSFCRKINQCKLQSIESVLPHKSLNKRSNNLKLTEYWCNRLIALYSDKSKMSKTMVQKAINEERLDKGLSALTYSTVNNFLNQPMIKNVTLKSRHGRRKFRNDLKPYLSMKSEYCNEIWEIDGMKIPFCCEISDQTEFLDVVIVIDVLSKKILGHSIGRNENFEMINAAIRNAIKNVNYLPREIVHDKHSPYFSRNMQSLQEKMVLFHVNWRSTNPDSPNEKGTIERVFGTLNTTFFRGLYGYIGEGIKSKREYSLPSPEAILEYRKSSNVYSLNQLSILVKEVFELYNNTSNKGRPTPNSCYQQSLSLPNKDFDQRKITPEDYAYLFFEENTYKVRRSMITFNRNNDRLNYTLPPEWRSKLNGMKVLVYYDPNDYTTIHIFSSRKEKDFYCSLNQDMKIPRRSEVWSKKEGEYVSKYISDLKKQEKEITGILDKAKSTAPEIQKMGIKMSRRYLIPGLDDKVIHKEIISKELLNFNGEDVEKFSIDVLRKNLKDIF